jgi:hypothetical protein
VKLLRTIRLDPSDTFIFERAAEPGEWAVSGAFIFWNSDASKLEAKSRAAFRGGFLGVISLGWSTLVQIVDAKPSDGLTVVEALANQLARCFGAPDMKAARTAAEEEVSFAQSLCDHPSGTLIAIHRTYDEGEIRESFRTLRPRDPLKPVRVFSFLEVEDENEGPNDEIDLVGLAKEKPE